MDIAAAALELLEMRRTHRIEPNLPETLRPSDLRDAYAIQDAVVAQLLSDGPDGAGEIGYKCACTSPIAQAALRIDRPVFGRLLSHTTSTSGASLDADRFVHRVVEAEFGFVLGRDVEPAEGGHTHDTIAQSIAAVVPAIEIVDHRFESWAIGALPIAADNAIHGWWIHGEPIEDWRRLDLGATAVSVARDGDTITSGSGANVLGHPLTVMAWLADELPRYGKRLCAGDRVTTGVTTDVFEASAGETIRAMFEGLGDVEVAFS